MAEPTGLDAFQKGVRGAEITTIDWGRLIYSYGRDYFSRFKNCVTGAGGMIVDQYGFENENNAIGVGAAKKILGIRPIELDPVRFGVQPVGTGTGEIRPGLLPLRVRVLVARHFGKIFTFDDKDLLDLQYTLGPLFDKVLMQAYGKKIDDIIIDSLISQVPSIVYNTSADNKYYNLNKRKPLAKYDITNNIAQYVFRDGAWTTPSSATVDQARFTPDSVYKILGFFIERDCDGPVYLQLTPDMIAMLSSTTRGVNMLNEGGVYAGKGPRLRFVATKVSQTAGVRIKTGDLKVASAFTTGTDVITVAARQVDTVLAENVTDRVLYDADQTMTATSLNNQASTTGFVDIECKRPDLVAAWSRDAVAFGEFEQLMTEAQKNDIRQNNAAYRTNRFGMNSVILDENKVLLFPVRGKNA